ncbi:hypothetical protein CDD81_5063 [Ophiocordyceps australis]|uniref:Uncharacterized protein n=1 Tax=Ophiocordyceps australis TaxID=1399860 RepID=A0A2C5Y9E8_9HYPO|nr:hypothetical protein CDD81_5063 [Ophiocordyceps australis]
MAKTKTSPGVPNKGLYSRASYLYQAAGYLASRATLETSQSTSAKTLKNLSRQTLSDMRAVCLKAQIRQSPLLKRDVCKSCHTFLIEGQTCLSVVENKSKDGLKPWADVLVVRCTTCAFTRRYPVSTSRQKRKQLRQKPPPRQ